MEVRKFFTYICLFMVTYMGYVIMKIIFGSASRDESLMLRVFDIVDIVLTVSYIVMLIGISTSIQRTISDGLK